MKTVIMRRAMGEKRSGHAQTKLAYWCCGTTEELIGQQEKTLLGEKTWHWVMACSVGWERSVMRVTLHAAARHMLATRRGG